MNGQKSQGRKGVKKAKIKRGFYSELNSGFNSGVHK